MSISEETVRKVAKLAALELKDDEVHTLRNQLGDILDYVDQLSKLSTEGINPTSHVHGVVNAFRDDIAKESLAVEKLEKIAPDFALGGFRVPKIIG